MKLSDALSKVSLDYLTMGYEAIVDMIRLPLLFKPVRLSGTTKMLGLKNPVMNHDGNEIAFKEIKYIWNVEYLDIPTKDHSSCLIGDRFVKDFGFDNIIDLNNNQEDIPAISFSGDSITVHDDNSMITIECYPYPYLLLHTDKGMIHKYDVSWMTDTYDEDDLMIDDFIGSMSIIKGLQYQARDMGDISSATNIERLLDSYINIHNTALLDIVNLGGAYE